MKQFRDTPYYVTEDGKVITKNGLTKKPTNNGNGYLQIGIYVNGKRQMFKLHRLIAECYIPNPDNKPQVNHIDGNKLNNCISNLEWVTCKENIRHAHDNGLSKGMKGETNHQSKLTKEDVINIRKIYIPRHLEFGQIALAKKYNVSKSLIGQIIKGQWWKHI